MPRAEELTPEAAAHLRTALKVANRLVDALSSAIESGGIPAYSVEAARFASAEAKVLRRRLGNMAKVLGAITGDEAGDA